MTYDTTDRSTPGITKGYAQCEEGKVRPSPPKWNLRARTPCLMKQEFLIRVTRPKKQDIHLCATIDGVEVVNRAWLKGRDHTQTVEFRYEEIDGQLQRGRFAFAPMVSLLERAKWVLTYCIGYHGRP